MNGWREDQVKSQNKPSHVKREKRDVNISELQKTVLDFVERTNSILIFCALHPIQPVHLLFLVAPVPVQFAINLSSSNSTTNNITCLDIAIPPKSMDQHIMNDIINNFTFSDPLYLHLVVLFGCDVKFVVELSSILHAKCQERCFPFKYLVVVNG